MLLSARVLNDVSSVNSFEVADQLAWTEGDSVTLTLQLIDASLDMDVKGFYPSGRRFMPADLSTLSVQIQNIDNSKVITRQAIQPFIGDASIWQVTILSTDLIHGTPQLLLTLTQPSGVTKGLVKNALRVFSTSNTGC